MKDFRIDFIGVGFGRTGSTWLTNCLNEHPDISIPKFNLHTEINYFPEEYEVMGIKNYIKKFKKCDFNKVIGELSTMIIMKKRSVKILKKLFPNTKIIIYIRNEEDRATSVYNIKKNYDLLNVKKKYIDQKNYIEPWIREFGRKKVHIFNMDNEKKNQELDKLFKFLEVRKFYPLSANKRFNESYTNRNEKKVKKVKYAKTRKLINILKPKLKKHKKIFYFMKRNLKFDYYFQSINHNL